MPTTNTSETASRWHIGHRPFATPPCYVIKRLRAGVGTEWVQDTSTGKDAEFATIADAKLALRSIERAAKLIKRAPAALAM